MLVKAQRRVTAVKPGVVQKGVIREEWFRVTLEQ